MLIVQGNHSPFDTVSAETVPDAASLSGTASSGAAPTSSSCSRLYSPHGRKTTVQNRTTAITGRGPSPTSHRAIAGPWPRSASSAEPRNTDRLSQKGSGSTTPWSHDRNDHDRRSARRHPRPNNRPLPVRNARDPMTIRKAATRQRLSLLPERSTITVRSISPLPGNAAGASSSPPRSVDLRCSSSVHWRSLAT